MTQDNFKPMKGKYFDCYVTFLKSSEGMGFTSTIRHDLSRKNWDGWYGHLRGIALNFTPQNEFETEVKARLAAQGVEFVSKPEPSPLTPYSVRCTCGGELTNIIPNDARAWRDVSCADCGSKFRLHVPTNELKGAL